MCGQFGGNFVQRGAGVDEVGNLRHFHTGITAGVDMGKRREIHIDVERKAVIDGTSFDTQPQRGDFAFSYINAGAFLTLVLRRLKSIMVYTTNCPGP